MEEEAIRALGEGRVRGVFKTFCATLFPALAALIMVVLFLWTIWSELKVADDVGDEEDDDHHDKPSIKTWYSHWAFYIGVLTIVLGFWFLAVGIPLLADLAMKLSEQLHNQEESRKHQGKLKTICIISRLIVSFVAMFLLAWAINTGIRLATEPRREGNYYPLASPVGVVTIMFGFTYSIIGLCVIAELALELANQLGTSTLSLMRSIRFSFFGREFPYDPLNRFPFFVFLSPLPHTIGPPITLILAAAATDDDDDDMVVKWARCSVISTRLATAPHHCIIAISAHNIDGNL